MPLKKDAGRRWVEMELELRGTPEQVWHAMATGPGNSAWFTPTEIEEREGGAIAFHLAPGVTSPGRVTTWEPQHRFAYEEAGWSGQAPPLETEITIEALSDGACAMRMTHGLVTSKGKWDKALERMQKGWSAFFGILRVYLTYFPGMRASSGGPTAKFAGSLSKTWKAAQQSLGLADVKVGEVHDTSVEGGPRVVGTIEEVTMAHRHRSVMLRLTGPAPGVALISAYKWGGAVNLAVTLIFYGESGNAVLAEERPKWQAWVDGQVEAQQTSA